MDAWHLIAGLGNPGRDYAETRHNAGFLAVDWVARRWGVAWRSEPRFEARVARVDREGRRCILCEPQTYMNLSGQSVGALGAYYKILPERTLVIVDDADLPFGSIRMRGEGSSGGHHGLESVEQHLATREYPRLRIGIGRREAEVREITDHVLGRFTDGERERFGKVLDRVADQVEVWLASGVQRAMNLYNGAIDAR